jgi:hypothetical protein
MLFCLPIFACTLSLGFSFMASIGLHWEALFWAVEKLCKLFTCYYRITIGNTIGTIGGRRESLWRLGFNGVLEGDYAWF